MEKVLTHHFSLSFLYSAKQALLDTAEATPAPAAPGLVHPRSIASGAAVLTGADLNLQTQPTRALWVGSIPSSTTPNHLLAIFSSFGQIESARVLTHKSCGVSLALFLSS